MSSAWSAGLTAMTNRDPLLAPFDALIGSWSTEAKLGFIALPDGAAELVFQVISEHNERAALRSQRPEFCGDRDLPLVSRSRGSGDQAALMLVWCLSRPLTFL